MAVKIPGNFSLFAVIFLSMMLVMLSWEHLSKNAISWRDFKLAKGDRWFESGFKWWEKVENLTLPPAALTSSTTKLPVVNLENPQTKPTTQKKVVETPMPVLSVKSFKKLPPWDFDDVYNQDGSPRSTTCKQSVRNSKDEKFRKVFLPNIRLFLHKDNINMSEWNRLSHFNNPFGFMGFKYDQVMASVKLIPKPKEPLLLPKAGGDGCVRCAVVGTAGILDGSKLGAEIDAHDYVFRMNGAVIKGYEDDVGSRTSVYVHTAHSITSSLVVFKKYGYKSAPHDEGIKYVMIPEGMRDYQWLEGLLKGQKVSSGVYNNRQPRTYYSKQFNLSSFYVLHQDFLRYVRNRFLKSKNLNRSYWPIVRPTNGAFTLFLALHTCDIVDAYGFITDDYAKYSNYYVQRHAKSKLIFYANHDYNLEKLTWKDLHNRKIIRLYQGKQLKN